MAIDTLMEELLYLFDPSYRPRWVQYDKILMANLSPEKVWLDLGCGDDDVAGELRHLCKQSVRYDIMVPQSNACNNFICGYMDTLPYKSGIADLITLRMVVEHLEDISTYFSEIQRVLKLCGRVIIVTTNKWSPVVIIPRVLPFRLKNFLISRIFSVTEEEVFPTYHRLNTPPVYAEKLCGLKRIYFNVSNEMTFRPLWIFPFFFVLHMMLKLFRLKLFGSNIIAVYQKEKQPE
jgi:ubiquinone/menaquinone biosynthesis C-methylase UbiE